MIERTYVMRGPADAVKTAYHRLIKEYGIVRITTKITLDSDPAFHTIKLVTEGITKQAVKRKAGSKVEVYQKV